MIISASRRTDIPAFFSDWLFSRLNEGYILLRNPINPKSVSRISMSPDVVDCIVFWTKNPAPMLDKLDVLKNYPFYFQFTLTPYGNDLEENLPPKKDIIETFKKLSDKISAERVIWRYDPILFNDKYSINYHMETYYGMAKELSGYTNRCVISFVDYYRSIAANIKELGLIKITEEDMHFIAKYFASASGEFGFELNTCAESVDLSRHGIGHARCIDDRIVKELTGFNYEIEKDTNQRLECGCVMSIDIGMYNTCLNGCKYCYANHSEKTVKKNLANYNPRSPLLCSELTAEDAVKDREMKSYRNGQIGFDII